MGGAVEVALEGVVLEEHRVGSEPEAGAGDVGVVGPSKAAGVSVPPRQQVITCHKVYKYTMCQDMDLQTQVVD